MQAGRQCRGGLSAQDLINGMTGVWNRNRLNQATGKWLEILKIHNLNCTVITAGIRIIFSFRVSGSTFNNSRGQTGSFGLLTHSGVRPSEKAEEKGPGLIYYLNTVVVNYGLPTLLTIAIHPLMLL